MSNQSQQSSVTTQRDQRCTASSSSMKPQSSWDHIQIHVEKIMPLPCYRTEGLYNLHVSFRRHEGQEASEGRYKCYLKFDYSAGGHIQKPARESKKNTNVRGVCVCRKKKKKVEYVQCKEECIISE